MKKMIQKTMTWLLVVCMIVGFVPAFGSAAAVEGKPIRSLAWSGDEAADAVMRANEPNAPGDFTELPTEGGSKEWNSDNLFGFLWDLLKAIGENLRALSVDEVLKLPANSMDDIVTYIFSAFKLLGINMDTIYEKFFSLFSFL